MQERKRKLPKLTCGRDKTTGQIRDIEYDDVPRGKACNCVCPECSRELIARLGETLRWHFAHILDAATGKGGCSLTAPEGASHYNAKHRIARIINSGGDLPYPLLQVRHRGLLREEYVEPIGIDRAETEVPLLGGTVEADDVLYIGEDIAIICEVFRTNAVRNEKLEKYITLGVPVLEFRVKRDDDDLEEQLKDQNRYRWLYHPRYSEILEELKEEAKRLAHQGEAPNIERSQDCQRTPIIPQPPTYPHPPDYETHQELVSKEIDRFRADTQRLRGLTAHQRVEAEMLANMAREKGAKNGH